MNSTKWFLSLCLALAGASTVIAAPTVESVIVRQQWPWSDLIKVEYCLSGVTNAANLSIQAWDGDEAIDTVLLRSAVVGDLVGITDNVGSFQINPQILFGNEKKSLEAFRVKIAAAEAVGDMDEILYKIFDLTNGSCENVTRRGLLNGHYGAYETDYAKIGTSFGISGFTTALDDVLIWTGVTNSIDYKTTKLVMRKIPAKGETFWMGGSDTHLYKAYGEVKPRRQVSLTNDYYMAVFELTEGQFLTIITNTPGSTMTVAGHDKMQFTNPDWRYVRPINVPDYILRYNYGSWPEAAGQGIFANNNSTLVGNLRKLTGINQFDLPTEACWEFAERAKGDSTFFCGLDTPDGNIHKKLGRFTSNSNMNHTNYRNAEWLAAWTPDEGGTAAVGSYPPNPFGLYDMAGNVSEGCLDHYTKDPTTDYDYYSSVDPWGPLAADAVMSVTTTRPDLYHVGKGGNYFSAAPYMSSGMRSNLYTNNSGDPIIGVRLCIRIDN